MIKLACNYYEETEELVKNGLIDIDYFKFPSLKFHAPIQDDFALYEKFLIEKKRIKPILLHGLFPSPHNICSPDFKENLEVELLKKIMELSETPIISLHFDGADENATEREIIKTAVGNLLFLRETFMTAEVISIENVENSKSRFMIEPRVISEVIREADVHLLLDVSHGAWSAMNRNESMEQYFDQLPLDRVHEIHINGWIEKTGDMTSHIKIGEEGYHKLEALLKRCAPEIITLEYGRDYDRIGVGCPLMRLDSINEKAKEEIIEQITRLREILATAK